MKKLIISLGICLGFVYSLSASSCRFQLQIYTTMPWNGHWFYPANVSYSNSPFDSTMYFLDIAPQDSIKFDYVFIPGTSTCAGTLWDWGIYKDGVKIDTVPGWQSFEKGFKEDGIYDLYAWNFSGRAHFRLVLSYAQTTSTNNLLQDNAMAWFDEGSHLQLNFEEEVSLSAVRLYNIAGHLAYWAEITDVLYGKAWQSPQSLQHLPGGIYICEVRDVNGKTSSRKIFKP